MLAENNPGTTCSTAKPENPKKPSLGDICCDAIPKDAHNKAENGEPEPAGSHLYKHRGATNGSIWARRDDHFTHRHLDPSPTSVEVKASPGEDLVIETNWACWCVPGDVHDVLIAGPFN